MNPVSYNFSSHVKNQLDVLSQLGENEKLSVEEKKVGEGTEYNLSISGSSVDSVLNYVPESVSNYVPSFFSDSFKILKDKVVVPLSRTWYVDSLPKTINVLTDLLKKIEKETETIEDNLKSKNFTVDKNFDVMAHAELPSGACGVLAVGLNNLWETYKDRPTKNQEEITQKAELKKLCSNLGKAASQFYQKRFKLLSSIHDKSISTKSESTDENTDFIPNFYNKNQRQEVADVILEFENRILRLRNFQISESLGNESKTFKTNNKDEMNNEESRQGLSEETKKSIKESFDFVSMFNKEMKK